MELQPDNQLGLEEYKNGEQIPDTIPVTTQEAEESAQETPEGQEAPMRTTKAREPEVKEVKDEKKDPLYVEGMTLLELKATHQNFCNHCKMVVPDGPKNRVVKKGHVQTVCRQCHNVMTQLYRNLDMQEIGWKDLPESQMVDFFKKAKSLSDAGGKLGFGKLKTLVEQTLVENEKLIVATRVNGKFLPLSVWQSKGYDVDQIKATAQKRESAMLLGRNIYIYVPYIYRTVKTVNLERYKDRNLER